MENNLPPGFKPPPGSVMDDRLLMREFYNANDFPVTFTRRDEFLQYITLSDKPMGPEKIVVQPGEWALLVHGFYLASWPDNRLPEEVIAHFNFGKDMQRGIKPNREVVRKAKRYVR
jgi:hypothetical protein